MKTSCITIFLLVMSCAVLFAQTDEVRAKAEFFMAEEAYNAKNFQKCLSHLDNTENLLGSVNPRILYLRIKASFETKQYSITKKAIDSFFEMEPNTNSEQYKEVLRIVAQMPRPFTDPRDGKTYKTVKIGNQVWMAENLAYKPSSGNYWAYDNYSSNVAKYGYLYDWQTAKNVCPTGWHLPSDAEWSQVENFVGSNPGTKLKAKSGWSKNGNGTDDYGFSALPGGYRYYDGIFNDVGSYGLWWSSTETGTTDAWARHMGCNRSGVSRNDNGNSWGFSVRCLRDL